MLQYKTLSFKAAPEDSGLQQNEFAGYASVFGVVDEDGDIIQHGAFALTLPDFLDTGLICWQHSLRVPIGKPIEAREDEKGLFLKGRISDTTQGRDCLTLMRDDVVKKLSIGYVPESYEMLSPERARAILGDAAYDEAVKRLPWWVDDLRLLTQIKLYEVSPVSIPANSQADITGVKSGGGRLPETEREFERMLRDAGYSRKTAAAIASHGFKAAAAAAPLQRDAGDEATPDYDALAAELKELTAALRA